MQERHAALELGQPSWLRDAQVAYITALATERDMKEQVFSQDFSKELPERQEMTIEDWGRRLEVRLRNFKKSIPEIRFLDTRLAERKSIRVGLVYMERTEGSSSRYELHLLLKDGKLAKVPVKRPLWRLGTKQLDYTHAQELDFKIWCQPGVFPLAIDSLMKYLDKGERETLETAVKAYLNQ